MVEYRFSEIEIESFRGIPSLNLKFHDKIPTYLIGANNSGKSTVLQSLALALSAGGMHLFKPERYDFFHRASGEGVLNFSITLNLDSSDETKLPAVQGVGNPQYVHKIRVNGKATDDFDCKHSHKLLGSDGIPIKLMTRTKLSAANKEKFKEQEFGSPIREARPYDIRSHLPEVWLLSADNLYASLHTWKTGPLNKLSQLLTKKFFEDNWEFDYAGKKWPMPQKIKDAHDFFASSVKEFPFWKGELKEKLSATLSGYLGRSSSIELQPSIQSVEEWLAQQLLVSFAADSGGAVTPIDRMGQGWQSLIRMACLEVLLDYTDEISDSVILLYEEPETYLHPHLRRKLRDILAALSAKGWMVVCTTHAPELISFASDQFIVKLSRNGDSLTDNQLLTESTADEIKFQEKLDNTGNHEMLFAQKVVLCESKVDIYALRLFLDKHSTELDSNSISIINCDGVTAVPKYAEIARSLGIPWLAITDKDLQDDGNVKPITKKAVDKISELKSESDLLLQWDNNLEDCTNCPQKADIEWLRENIASKDADSIQTELPNYYGVISGAMDWINDSSGSVDSAQEAA